MRPALSFLYLLALSVWLGTVIFHSFVVAPILFRSLPQTVAGDVVARIFPIYYMVGYGCGVVSVVVPWFLASGTDALRAWRGASGVAAVMLVLTIAAGTVIHPRAAALRREMASLPDHAPQRVEFRRLHGAAVAANLLVLSSGLVLLFMVSRQLRW
ncbi:MAG: hypothetical protein KatS3mg077_0921 [Candidatus Binatia bacterium]|nr:MAG: hypothetical protein KatS3mg077_0921 [Candidatus Binatia bacterium]